MWIALSLMSAVGAAGSTLLLKQAVDRGGVVAATVGFRLVAGATLVALALASGVPTGFSPAYWRVTAVVLPPEVGGMVLLSLALRAGDVTIVQPLMGTLPLFVMLIGIAVLGEVPSARAALGIVLVTAGVYCVGLRRGASMLEPLRSLARSRASWYAVGASALWSVTTVLHKFGIAEVGPLPWGATVTLGSAAVLAVVAPFLRPRGAAPHAAATTRARWVALVATAGLFFAMQQVGLQLSLQQAPAGYVIALCATSTLIAIVLAVVLLRERTAVGHRVLGGVLVSAGAALIALFG